MAEEYTTGRKNDGAEKKKVVTSPPDDYEIVNFPDPVEKERK